FRIQDYTFRVANSNDVLANHRGTLVFAYLTAKCGSKGKFGEGILKALNTSIRSLDFAALGATVARRAAANLKARAFKGKLPGTGTGARSRRSRVRTRSPRRRSRRTSSWNRDGSPSTRCFPKSIPAYTSRSSPRRR